VPSGDKRTTGCRDHPSRRTERRLKDNPTTLEELSQQYGISRERVRQIEVPAFEKLQKAMKVLVAGARQAYR
jgi:RNA polymerase sigma-32 factor